MACAATAGLGACPLLCPRVLSLDLAATAAQVALAFYVNLGSHMLLQVEALLSLLLLPMAEGRAAGPGGAHSATPLELQQVALEGVLDFCAQPGFARDIYLNLDCRWGRGLGVGRVCGARGGGRGWTTAVAGRGLAQGCQRLQRSSVAAAYVGQ